MSMPLDQHANPNDTYTSPLASRNASPEMLALWSPRHKFNTWRRIWLAVAESQARMSEAYVSRANFPVLVTRNQVEALRTVVQRGITDEEMRRASELETVLRHDVMAHVHCLGEVCPEAKPIIHLGCTSQDVVCNADWIVLVEAISLVFRKSALVVASLADVSTRYRSVPCLGFTHYQAAQPVTVGRRTVQWAHDLLITHFRLDQTMRKLYPRGFKGATGTQASFLSLFAGDHTAVSLFEDDAVGRLFNLVSDAMASGGRLGNHAMDYDFSIDLTGQTYPRVIDTFILADLGSVAAVLHKIATDIRLLSNRKEIDEPFGDKQIGSSAMPYKRNPMKCERICGLTRFVMNLVGNAYDTAATQWLERTLDDSSNRRLSLPEAFLALDGALDLMHNVASGLVVNEAMIRKNLMEELPFLATENILMEAVKAGGDRQDLHEKIRVHAQAAGARVKQQGLDNDLITRLRADPAFAAVHHLLTEDQLLDPMQYIGRSVEQTERFIKDVIEPLQEQYADDLNQMQSTDRGV